MKAIALVILTSCTLLAMDMRQQNLSEKAEADYSRVATVYRPNITDAGICVQSQAAALATSAPEDRAVLYYRKGFCAFAAATAETTADPAQFLAAAAEFDKAIEAWPARIRKPAKNAPPDPVAPTLRAFATIARLNAAPSDEAIATARRELATILQSPACHSELMSPGYCGQVLGASARWMGWIALRLNDPNQAARCFINEPASGWSDWADGKRAFAAGKFPVAAARYSAAITRWKKIWQTDGPTIGEALGPKPDFGAALADWGAARLLTGDLEGAIATLDSAVQTSPTNARALFLRARARDLSGQADAAQSDYNLASRTAFAGAVDLASGEAHLYRGIFLYRRQDFARAESEFSSALNFEMTDTLRPDARAWRHLAAMAQGSCEASRQSLQQALPSVSPYFPKEEAAAATTACNARAQIVVQ